MVESRDKMFGAIGNFFIEIGSVIGDFFAMIAKMIVIFFTTATQEEYLLPTLLAIAVILMKLLINNRVCALDMQLCLIEMPCEILILAFGFLISNIQKYWSTESKSPFIDLVFVLIILMVDTAIVNWLKRSAGKLKRRHVAVSALCYVMAVYAFGFSISGMVRGI